MRVLVRGFNKSLALLLLYFTGITQIYDHLFIERINSKTKQYLIHFTHLNDIDEKKNIDTNKPVQQPI